LQLLALKELNFSMSKTRLIAEQLFEGISFEKEGYGGLITCPCGEIKLASENRTPESVKPYLTGNQFTLYELIHSSIGKTQKISSPAECSDLSMVIKLESLGLDWADVYSIGIASLLKRKYIEPQENTFKVTELGRRVMSALKGFFDEDFSVDAYKKISAQVVEISEGRAEKKSVIENYCNAFNKNFDKAMSEFGEDATPQEEPEVLSGEVCEKCGSPMIIKRGRYGTFLACANYPECKNTKPIVQHLEHRCPKCGERLTKREFGRGRSLYSCEHYPHCDFQTWDEPQTTLCKVCGATMFTRRFKNRAPMFYCGNESCPTRKDHPINKILADAKKRAESKNN